MYNAITELEEYNEALNPTFLRTLQVYAIKEFTDNN